MLAEHTLRAAQQANGMQRQRARELGIRIGVLQTGERNAITDVPGVAVGHRTLVEGDDIRTGVTAIVPHAGNVFQQKVPAAVVVGNAFGKLVGSTQVEELGTLETPIVLTNTLSSFAAAEALVAYTLRQPGNDDVRSVNPLVGECNDGRLNAIRALRVEREDVFKAISAANTREVPEGSIGAGTGMSCFGWKGGIGTSSRQLPVSLDGHAVGVLVLTNFGGVLNVGGAPVGKELGRYYLKDAVSGRTLNDSNADGSCIVVVATNAPLDARQLKRLGKRALFGLAAVGSSLTHGSGEYVIAFSTNEGVRVPYQTEGKTQTTTTLRDDALSPLFQAVREATEEAVLNSLFMATDVTGANGRTVEAIPLDRVVEICKQYNVIQADRRRPLRDR